MGWLEEHPEVQNIRCGAADLNGQARGKRLPVAHARKAEDGGMRFPLSALSLDIWGHDIEDSPLVFESGDADGVLRPTGRGYVPMPWLDAPAALLPVWMYNEDGTPFEGDPRHALAAVVDRLAERGLTPVVATELEFYLLDDAGETVRPPRSPRSGKRRTAGDILSLRALDAFDNFFNELYAACEAMDIPAEAATSESGLAQFEITLTHQADALKAADDAWFFKMLVRGLARKHGMLGSFMAKPYGDWAGNGLHTHVSLVDERGENVFANGTQEGSHLLLQAIAGCLRGIPDLTLIFAPHGNSYERLVPDSHAPTGISWAYENRTASLRVPGGSPEARRLEHRVAGGDANPYLFLAAVLGSALTGIEDGLSPPPPIEGNAYAMDLPQIPDSWEGAIAALESSALARRILPESLIETLIRTKRQELAEMSALAPEEQHDIYLDSL